jgi:hypothetical protein
LILKAIFALLSRLYNTVNGFKNQLNSHWKDLEIKFRPDTCIYKPEVTNGYDQSRSVAGAN